MLHAPPCGRGWKYVCPPSKISCARVKDWSKCVEPKKIKMNVHHLELFYYVAKHGGIMPAVRNIPYGIQQPAVSAQVSELEEFLGGTLFSPPAI